MDQQDKIKSYTNDDVNKVLQKAYQNSLEDRQRAIEIFNAMKEKIDNHTPDELFIMTSINNILGSIQKENDNLIKLAGVMQRLQSNTITQIKKAGMSSDEYNNLLTSMDELEKQHKLEEGKSDSGTDK